ncbi:hypothetical protein ERHA54_50110 (plasmid) [Erwinia rhapontici]|nr:hypothetical protein ERHA54_50110 [Erwinia rhapontici]
MNDNLVFLQMLYSPYYISCCHNIPYDKGGSVTSAESFAVIYSAGQEG